LSYTPKALTVPRPAFDAELNLNYVGNKGFLADPLPQGYKKMSCCYISVMIGINRPK